MPYESLGPPLRVRHGVLTRLSHWTAFPLLGCVPVVGIRAVLRSLLQDLVIHDHEHGPEQVSEIEAVLPPGQNALSRHRPKFKIAIAFEADEVV